MAKAKVPGAVVSKIARRWQICPQQVFAWRRAALRGTSTGLVTTEPAFVPIMEGPRVPDPAAKTASRMPEIEIDTGGAKIRVAGGVGSPRCCVRHGRPLRDRDPDWCEDHAGDKPGGFSRRRA